MSTLRRLLQILRCQKVKCANVSGVTLPRRSIQTSSKLRDEGYADVIIAGGGMVGTSLACALGSSHKFQNRKVLLLEATAEPVKKTWNNNPFENRVSAITPGSRTLLEDVGIWKEISKRRYHQFNKMQVWDGCASGMISFDSRDMHSDHIAYIIENSVIVESCTERVKELNKTVEVKYKTKLDNLELPSSVVHNPEKLVTAHLENGDVVKTKLLVGADGFNSFVRHKAQLETYDYDYGQSAVVASLKIESKTRQNTTAWQRFLPTGPIALLPMSDEFSSLVWSTSREQAKELMRLPDEEFVTRVNDAFNTPPKANTILDATNNFMKAAMSTLEPGRHAANYMNSPPLVVSLETKSRGMFPLGLKHSHYYVKSRLALVGDAAHRIHPMAGQGVNLGFGDVRCLVNVIEECLSEGGDFGILETLLPYETERQRNVVPIISAINALNSLFSTNQLSAVLTRTLGLQATNLLSPIKNRIVKYAMG